MSTHAPLVLVANAGDGSISTFALADGELTRLAVTPGITGCSTFAVDAERDLVHAAVKPSHDGENAGILTLDLDRETGALTPRSRLDLPEGGLNYIALTRGGTGLLAASYGAGYGFTARVEDGEISAPVSRVAFANLHAVLASPDGAHAYFVSLGDDLIAQYALGEDMALHALAPETVPAPAGSGPRHHVISDDGASVLVLTEFTAEVLRYARDAATGTLELVGSAPASDPSAAMDVSRFGLSPQDNHVIWAADLHWGSPTVDGTRHVWASERQASTLAAVAVAPDGAMTAPSHFTVTQPQPRGFALSPDGAHLVAAGERSTSVSLYAVDGDRLTLLQETETGAGANWVRFV
ncbi:lactonase family protein [Litorihabitans aurantiacus]|uniref:6-phosphogluconolactonase n=1 Tax=Litorihabitans aurantiacus TaxID=1930061 RepID=A0AA37XG97_9MICO|nr:beta-propeller fold lactonase family protein [Litorihabitans aurantiacus]GMA33028.1 6-phosphogluconolactonase [Litorihabitans aurantiacus]